MTTVWIQLMNVQNFQVSFLDMECHDYMWDSHIDDLSFQIFQKVVNCIVGYVEQAVLQDTLSEEPAYLHGHVKQQNYYIPKEDQLSVC